MSAVKETACTNGLHDWPMPSRYLASHAEATWRLRNGWRNVRCRDCGRYGWVPGTLREGQTRQSADSANGDDRG